MVTPTYPVQLRCYTVQGWRKESPASTKRTAMKPMEVQAVNGQAAAATYARCNSIPRKFWDDNSASPLIVIRVKPSNQK